MKSHLDLYERYVTAWSAMSVSERAALLEQTVKKDVAYRDAMVQCADVSALGEHLQAFQERSPGSSFRLISMLSWDSDAWPIGRSSMRKERPASRATMH